MYCVAKSDAVKIKTAAAILVGSGRRCSDEEYILQRAAKGLLAEAAMPADAEEVVPAQVVLPAADDDGAPPPIALLLSSLLVRRDESLIAVIVLRGSMVMMSAMRIMIGMCVVCNWWLQFAVFVRSFSCVWRVVVGAFY